jgi:hypothetical protein
MWVGGQCHASAALPPGKTQYPLYRRLGGPQGQSGQVQKISLPLEFDPWTVQPVVSCYPGPRCFVYTSCNIRDSILCLVYYILVGMLV